MTNLIDHPSHYQSEGGVEVIDVIELYALDFALGNAVKYLLRAGKKGNGAQDDAKALWYLRRWESDPNGTVELPGSADERALELVTPDDVGKVFGLEHHRAVAVRHILNTTAFSVDAEDEIAMAISALEERLEIAA